ncbi:MAG TPA: TlpA disulfide reductase family protein [Luteibacter sp.]|nr:TlpA disulfide reductase family protein [Luteibacter sp.]
MFRASYMWIVLLAAIAAGVGLYVEHRRIHPPPPAGVLVAEVGDRRPELALVDLEGHPRKLAEWDGKRVLINFWATWCGPCRKEMPLLSQAQQRFASHDVQVLGIAEDAPDAVRAYLTATSVGYPILLGTEPGVFASMHFDNTRELLPYSVLIGRDGKILKRKLGPFDEAELEAWLAD